MKEKIHNYTEKPQYQNDKGDFVQSWSDGDIDHKVDRSVSNYDEYLVFDIETTLEIPKRPILLTAYDTGNNKLFVYVQALTNGEGGKYRESRDKTAEICKSEFEKTGRPVDDVEVKYSITNSTMDALLYYIKDQPDSYALVGHNIFFDLGLMGTNADAMLGDGFDANQWDSAIQYNDHIIVSCRAGAYGRLYNITNPDSNNWRDNIGIIDTQAVAKAIRHQASLERLSEQLEVEYSDNATEHGELTVDYIKYNIDDIRATLDCMEKLESYFVDNLGTDMSLSDVFSSASIGKDALKRMNYDRTHYEKQAVDITSRAYFGGQTEALKTGEIIEGVTYADILSQYPTVSALMGLWDYMVADKVTVNDSSIDELPTVNIGDLKDIETWQSISKYYVSIDAENTLLPIRVHDESTETTRVKKARVDCSSQIYHYADVVGAMLYDDANISINKVWRIEPEGQKDDLRPTKIGGTEINPTDNFMRRTIEERKRIQYDENGGDKDANTLALKICANSCYGITAERISHIMRGDNGTGDEILRRFDEAGTYYNPHIATSTTAGGRLMLSIAEVIAQENGGQIYYCDTDSVIVDDEVADDVLNYFNDDMPQPYSGTAGTLDMLEIEEGKNDEQLKGVNLFAVSEKKYCILDNNNNIIDYKEHGLGHYSNMRDNKTVKQFWRTLLNATVPKCNYTDDLGTKATERLEWQTKATTKETRQMLDELVNDKKFRYGDFVKQTIAKTYDDRNIFYIGVGMSKGCYKVNKDGKTVKIEQVDEIQLRQKKIHNVVDEWKQTATNADGRDRVKVVGNNAVSKQASDIKQAYRKIFINATKRLENAVLKEKLREVDISPLL